MCPLAEVKKTFTGHCDLSQAYPPITAGGSRLQQTSNQDGSDRGEEEGEWVLRVRERERGGWRQTECKER